MGAALLLLFTSCALLLGSRAALDTSFKEYKFRTKLDHFAFHNNKTFEIRYVMADQYWDHDGGPIFFYAGNEAELEKFIRNTGVMWEWAPEFNALVVFAEHRYYGQSLPFGDKSYESPNNIGYLASEQALADYADLILHLKYTLPGAEMSPVVAFGGSYGGMLAAWFRLKYPHIVDAALASSAPVNMSPGLVPCGRFNEAVTAAFERESQLCADALRKSWTELQKLGYSEAGCRQLGKKFGLCQSLHPSNYTLLRDWIKESYSILALANFPEPSDLVGSLPAYPVREACKGFIETPANKRSALVDAVVKAVGVLYNSTGKRRCNDLFIFQRNLGGYRFQTCNELMMATCGNGVTDMFFPYTWNATAERERCWKEFGVWPDFYRTIMLYGGDSFETATNIIFSNGELDPWSAVGVLEPPSDDVVVLLIPGVAHHADLRFSRPSDSPELVRARQIEKNYIRHWISNFADVGDRRLQVLVDRVSDKKKEQRKRKLLIKHLL
ncbi:lysosomal Pro-X carboxypeptidase-like [Amblyomma americanum]